MDRAAISGCLIALLAVGCSQQRALTVASKNFTEQVILGEIVAQQVERRLHIEVDRKLNLGGTLLAHQALISGEIDLYPEYTGTALTAILKQPASSDAAAVLERVRAGYRKQWQAEWLPPLGFNDTFAMVVRADEARRDGLQTLSDAARRPSPWGLGVGYEFEQRPDGLAGLRQAYGLRIDGSPRTMDLGLLYKALDQKQVEMVAGNSTDGLLSVLDVRVLDDDKRYFPPYQAAVVARQAVLDRVAGLRGALEELSGKLNDETMRRLNYQVDGEHRPVPEVAAAFLAGLH